MDLAVKEFIDVCRKDGQAIERLITAYYSSRPQQASFVDGGCHAGYHSFRAAKHFQRKTISIDANVFTYKAFLRNLSDLPPLFIERILPVYGALQENSSKKSVTFNCSSSHPGRSSMNTKAWESWGNGEVKYESSSDVPAWTIDNLARKFDLNDIGFIKLDLESGEFDALRGAKWVLDNQRPHIALEYGVNLQNQEIMGHSQQDIFNFFDARNYSLISPWAEHINATQEYPFWEIFAIPNEQLEQSKTMLQEVFNSRTWLSSSSRVKNSLIKKVFKFFSR